MGNRFEEWTNPEIIDGKPPVIIRENLIVGVHSFVNKDIPDNVAALGVPVEILKKVKK